MFIRKVATIVAFSTLALTVAGCASQGNETLRTQDVNAVNQAIIDGQTTREQVLAIYGMPSQTTFLNEKTEIWTYAWSRATAQGQNFIPIVGTFARGYDVRSKKLVIIFNDKNIVARHSMLDNSDTVKTGLLDNGPPPTPGSVPVPPTATGAASAVMTAAPASPVPQGGQQVATSPGSSEPAADHAANQQKSKLALSTSSSGIAGAPPAAGVWMCVVDNIGNKTNPRYTLQFVVGSDNAIAVTNYDNAPATIVQREPLIFTALNPHGARQIKFTWRSDNSMIVTGPSTSDPNRYFLNPGTCTKAS